jgi:polysaccharide deacetylase 2 family uncharacterized protein YibQ
MGLITGGVVSAAALGLLSQWSLDRSGKPAQNDSTDIADSQAQDSPDTGTSLQSGAVPIADTDEAETTSQSDDAMADDAAGAEPDAEQEATTAPATDDDAVSADDTASEPTEDAAAKETSETETEAETVAEQDDTSTTETGSETTGADVVAADAPADDTAEADSQDQPTTDEITSEQTAEAETIPEDPNANAPVPDVSQSIGQSTPQDATQLTAPTVTDRATGEAVAVITSIRRTGEPAPEAPTAEGQPAVSTTPATRPVEDAPEEAVAEAEPEQDTATPAPEDTSDADAPADDAAANEDTDDAADADQTADAEAAPMIGTKGGDLKSLTPEIKINRLPTLGQSAEPETDATETAQAAPVADDPDLPVLQRYATAFENPENKPLMSIVLMDQGTVLDGSDVGVEALNQFPHPVTLAVDSSLPDAAERMKRYRDAGFEVMATVDLPEGFTAQDTEVSMSVILDDLPEVIGVLEGVGTGIQSNRTVSLQVASILAQTGHGLITQDKGLNTGTQVAERAGVPVQGVFRDIDSKNQTAVVIRRFLDNAAFKAGQEDGIVLLGRVRPDTISALLLWGLRDRAERVAIAPASTVLLNR